jgi:polyisoprenoid-binding protein YceI
MAIPFRRALLLLLTSLSACALAAGRAPGSGPARYTQRSGSSLAFTFTQLGSATEGRFDRFDTELVYDEHDLAASRLRVTVHIDSLDTQDDERNGVLLTPDLFDAEKHPTATFVAGSLVRGSGGLEAVGKLTLRGVTRDLRLPLTIRPNGAGLELSGQTVIRRLEFGVGQGEFRSTESVGDEVKIRYRVALARAG